MKSGIPPYRYLIIPAGILVILLMAFCWINLPTLVKPLLSWMTQRNIKPSAAWFSGAVILILAVTGLLMCGIIGILSRLEDQYLKKHQPPVNPGEINDDEIDETLRLMEYSLAKLRKSSEEMKVQKERIVALNRRLFGGPAVRVSERQEASAPEPSPPGVPRSGERMGGKPIGAADIHAPGGSGKRPGTGEFSEDYRVLLPEEKTIFIEMIEKFTCLLRYTAKE
jgi:hypothetical protein